MKNQKMLISMVIACTILLYICSTTTTYATSDTETNGISIGEQQPPTKPPTEQETTEIPATSEKPTENNSEKTTTENTPESIIIEDIPEPTYYTVTFDLNGGQGTIPNISVQANMPITSLNTNVQRPGYDFIGWFTKYNTPITKNTIITEDTYAIAKWKTNGSTPYTIIQKIQKLDGSYEVYKTITKKDHANSHITVTPEPITGFTTPESQKLYVTEDETASITFQYTRNTYKLNLKTKTGIINKQKTFTYLYDEPVTLNVYLAEDYTNLTVSDDVTEKTFKMPAKNINVTVSSEPATYKIKYKGYGINTNKLTKTYSIETLPIHLEKPIITSKFYQFNEWTYDGKPIKEITDTSHTDMIIKAHMSIQWNYVLIYAIPAICIIILICTLKHFIKRKKERHDCMDNNASETL